MTSRLTNAKNPALLRLFQPYHQVIVTLIRCTVVVPSIRQKPSVLLVKETKKKKFKET